MGFLRKRTVAAVLAFTVVAVASFLAGTWTSSSGAFTLGPAKPRNSTPPKRLSPLMRLSPKACAAACLWTRWVCLWTRWRRTYRCRCPAACLRPVGCRCPAACLRPVGCRCPAACLRPAGCRCAAACPCQVAHPEFPRPAGVGVIRAPHRLSRLTCWPAGNRDSDHLARLDFRHLL